MTDEPIDALLSRLEALHAEAEAAYEEHRHRNLSFAEYEDLERTCGAVLYAAFPRLLQELRDALTRAKITDAELVAAREAHGDITESHAIEALLTHAEERGAENFATHRASASKRCAPRTSCSRAHLQTLRALKSSTATRSSASTRRTSSCETLPRSQLRCVCGSSTMEQQRHSTPP